MNLEHYRQHLRDLANVHLQGEAEILANKQANFMWMLDHMTQRQRHWWFRDRQVQTIDDIQHLPERSSDDLLAAQQSHPPYGIFEFGEVLVQNSGSTHRRKNFPFGLDAWYRYILPASRGLLYAGVGPGDVVLTTDPGLTQAGYRTPEEAAAWVCGAQILIDRSVNLVNKLTNIRDHAVTVLIANWSKLERMAELKPRQYFQHDLKLIISTGLPMGSDPGPVMRAFDVDWIMDFYGSSEMGNIYYTCRHGHRHVHDDFVHVQQKEGSLFTNLSGLPVWNYRLGDRVEHSYKGQCACGSYLPTVDRFESKSFTGLEKG